MRDRLEEKDGVIEKKGKQVLQVQGEKKRVEGELAEVRDHMDIKERKINVLHRKVSLPHSKYGQIPPPCPHIGSVYPLQIWSNHPLPVLT